MRLLLSRSQEVDEDGNRRYSLDYFAILVADEPRLLIEHNIAHHFARSDLEPMIAKPQRVYFADVHEAVQFEVELDAFWTNIASYLQEVQDWQGDEQKEYFFDPPK
jgi:hypothetical protein